MTNPETIKKKDRDSNIDSSVTTIKNAIQTMTLDSCFRISGLIQGFIWGLDDCGAKIESANLRKELEELWENKWNQLINEMKV
jgi:hypothetical protein